MVDSVVVGGANSLALWRSMELGRHSSLVNAWSARLQLQLPRPKQNCFDTHKAKHGLPWLSLNFTIAPAIWISGRHGELFVSMAHSAAKRWPAFTMISFISAAPSRAPCAASVSVSGPASPISTLPGAPSCSSRYSPGVTRCCRWRWADCAENESMSPHRDRFQMMYPV